MKTILGPAIAFLALTVTPGLSQTDTPVTPAPALEAMQVEASTQSLDGKSAVRVVKNPAVKEFDEPTFARLKGIEFTNGTIEVKVLSKLLQDAPDFARGFIGIAFRADEANKKFECIYLRPTNARSDDQVRRNHSIQYFAYPDHKFQRLRKESPELYEAYADMELGKWIPIKIEVQGSKAKLYLHGNEQPALVVNDLKLGPNAKGGIGFWVDVGTEGYFADLKVTESK